jgi:Ca2+-binding RTX toxin-like protein
MTTPTPSNATVGTPIRDTAFLSGRPLVPTADGDITFRLYGPGDTTCAGPILFSDITTANATTNTYTSRSFTPTTAGTYNWVVTYQGDPTTASAASTCGAEPVTITGPTPGPGTGLGACDLNSAAFQDALADGYQLHFVGPSHHYTGGSDRELIIGTNGRDVIDGGSNDDIICGLGGRDRIDGGSGNDQIDGGNGHDVIDGGSGNDTIVDIENGRDTVISSSGNDTIT